jgi:hypothetical protein
LANRMQQLQNFVLVFFTNTVVDGADRKTIDVVCGTYVDPKTLKSANRM